jgi:hypothetical protein
VPEFETLPVETVEEAKETAANQAGPVLVLAPETLQQIEEAEAAGGFEGGMSGADGTSQEGSGPDASSATDPPPTDPVDQGELPDIDIGVLLEEAAEKFLELRELRELFKEGWGGPIILVPKKELDRWLGVGEPDAA